MNTRIVEEYLKLPYTIEIIREEDEENPGWVARVVELNGCITQADTFEELGEMIEDAIRAWVEVALEDDLPIPEPRPIENYSGKFVVRVPKSLHRELVEAAERDSVSLNAYINVALGKTVGQVIPIEREIEKDDAISPINWPQLSDQARRALIANGMNEEVQEVDERMFAGWIEEHVNQIQAAIELGYYREALDYTNVIHNALITMCGKSPILSTYCRVFAILQEQIELNRQMRDGIISQTITQQRINIGVRKQYERTSKSERFSYLGYEILEGIIPKRISELQDIDDRLYKIPQKKSERD